MLHWIIHVTVVVLAAACGSFGQAAEPSSPETASAAPVDPVDLVGLWSVLDAGEEPGAVLRLDVGDLRLSRACGAIFGAWDADHDGAFLAASGGWSSACGDAPWPDWLTDATTYRPDGDGHVLLDASGDVLARLRPGEEPTLPPTIAQHLAAAPVLTDETRRDLAPAVPLPDGFEAADTGVLVGRWVPADAPPLSKAHVVFEPGDEWTASDGCNGTRGRWRLLAHGRLLSASTGDSTAMGCENIPVASRLIRTARAGLDSDQLVLLDRQGDLVGRFDRDACRPDPTALATPTTATFDTAEQAARSVAALPEGGTLEELGRDEWRVLFGWVTDQRLTHRIVTEQQGTDGWRVATYEQCKPSQAAIRYR